MKLALLLFNLIPAVLSQVADTAQLEEASKEVQGSFSNEHVIKGPEYSLKVTVLDPKVIRIQGSPSHQFEDRNYNVVLPKAHQQFSNPKVELKSSYSNYLIQLDTKYKVQIDKKDLKLTVLREGSPILQELQPLKFESESNKQTLKQFELEHYFGLGTQNGRFQHRNKVVNVSFDFNWEDNANPNAVPLYHSTNGYSRFTNTIVKGQYNFSSPTSLQHDESYFDSYYFLGTIKQALNYYTQLTGRPNLLPIFGYQHGDSDCYYKQYPPKPERDTLIDSTKVAKKYRDLDLPLGYMFLNDGFKCGYTNLKQTVQSLNSFNIEVGLFKEDNSTNDQFEILESGTKIKKLDAGWSGIGYDKGLKICDEAYANLEKFSNQRGFVWQIEGWAGSHRCAVLWTGDQPGSLNTIKYHIPTLHGAGLSSQVYISSDLDGIIGGSLISYVRDIQFKAFVPVSVGVSGWAETDRQPWNYNLEVLDIARKYLKLKTKLLPYTYTFAYQAYKTGVPIIRSHILEYPEDPNSYSDNVKYQFLYGDAFLVAPVYTNDTVKDNIYLPKGKFIDYWSHKVYTGPTTLKEYPTPLDTLPLFVKANSIIPNWDNLNSHKERQLNSTLYVDVYPTKSYNTNTFNLYEDDLVSKDYKNNRYSTQAFKLDTDFHSLKFAVDTVKGSYAGSFEKRDYKITFILEFNTNVNKVLIDGKLLNKDQFKVDGNKVTVGIQGLKVTDVARIQIEY